ncbi:hypothetical protein [Motiliproteus sediminis]|uniref:hypothetical protein n=1 Tax=Motiliproteus sediminis TaxID=1468178 RepID=UPI001AEF7B1E|nr:hypothetical protein [Motiliproteus sediminis]
MACSAEDCTVIIYQLSDPRFETTTNCPGKGDDDIVRTYPVPTEDDPSGIYNIYPHPEMRDAFASAIARAIKDHPKREELGCGKGCGCSESVDPEDALRTERRVAFRTCFTYNDGGKAILAGSYLLTTTRIKGICTPGTTALPPPSVPVIRDPDEVRDECDCDGNNKRTGKKRKKTP